MSGIGKEKNGTSSRLLEFLIFQVPVLLTLGSFVAPPEYNFLPVTEIFEVVFFYSAFLLRVRQPGKVQLLMVGLSLWALIRIIYALDNAPVSEVLRAHKWIFYLIVLCFYAGFQISKVNYIVQLTSFLIIVMAVKYVIVTGLQGLASRPGVFTENNYELFLVIGLFAVSHVEFSKHRARYLWLLILVVAISGSRSAAIGLIVLIFYLVLTSKTTNTFTKYLYLLLSGGSFLLAFYVFTIRQTTLENLDRLNFLNSFLFEVRNWRISEWLFGNSPITPLSIDTCNRLAFYESLLSSNQDGSCYSVIFHSFFLRVVFDFGLVGLAVAITSLIVIMTIGKVNKSLIITLSLLTLVNGMSVSGQNNVYVILPIAFALMMPKRDLASFFALRQNTRTSQGW